MIPQIPAMTPALSDRLIIILSFGFIWRFRKKYHGKAAKKKSKKVPYEAINVPARVILI